MAERQAYCERCRTRVIARQDESPVRAVARLLRRRRREGLQPWRCVACGAVTLPVPEPNMVRCISKAETAKGFVL